MRCANPLTIAVFLLALPFPARADFPLEAGRNPPLLMNRTPALFLTDPAGPKADPKAHARAQVDGKTLRVTLSWEDPTEDAVAGAKRAAYGGDALSQNATGGTGLFGGAAALM